MKRTELRVLFPDLVRPLTPDEARALRDAIARDGVLTPLLVDDAGGVLDGANRLAIAGDLGIDDVPVEVLAGLDDEAKRRIALSANTDRRQFSPSEQKSMRDERVRRVAEKRRAGKTLRAIAAEEGVSLAQIQRDVEDASPVPPGTNNNLVPPGTRKAAQNLVPGGTSDKEQDEEPEDYEALTERVKATLVKNPHLTDEAVAQRLNVVPALVGEVRDILAAEEEERLRDGDEKVVNGKDTRDEDPPFDADPPAEEPAAAADDAEPEAELVLRDRVGVPVPPHMRVMWLAVRAAESQARLHLRRAAQAVEELCRAPGGEHLKAAVGLQIKSGEHRHRSAHVEALLRELRFNLPYACVCPHCHHAGRTELNCRSCRGLGWVSEEVWDACPRDYRDAALKDLGAVTPEAGAGE